MCTSFSLRSPYRIPVERRIISESNRIGAIGVNYINFLIPVSVGIDKDLRSIRGLRRLFRAEPL